MMHALMKHVGARCPNDGLIKDDARTSTIMPTSTRQTHTLIARPRREVCPSDPG